MRITLLMVVIFLFSGCSTGYRIHKSPLSPTAGAWTISNDRSYVFLGTIDYESSDEIDGALGSNWCIYTGVNGRADCISDEILDGTFTSCIDLYPNGVLTDISMGEVRKRRWSFAAVGCQDMDADGNFGGDRSIAQIFSYGGQGSTYSASIPEGTLAVGALNQWKAPGSKRLRSIKLYHSTPQAIFMMGQNGVSPSASPDVRLTGDFAPPIPTGVWTGTGAESRFCLPGRVMTGAFVGHKLDRSGAYGKVWYLVGECRTLLYLGPG